MRLEGARALVTGASRGIGRALALALSREGARVLGCARDRARLADLARESGGAVRVEVADLSRPADAERVVGAAVEAFGGLDLLVNNAGTINEPGTVRDLAVDEWRRVLEVNVLGVVATLRAALPHLERSGGSAVNVSSYWGRHGAASFGPYCASKFAVEGVSQSAAAEAERATVVALSPGIVATDMLEVAFGGETGGAASPEDCARRFVAFLGTLDRRQNGKPVEI